MGLLAFLVASALAVHDTGKFQLDGDASSATQPFGPKATDDWDKVCHQVIEPVGPGTKCSTTENTSGATAVSWTAEPGLSSTIFTGGGSKDPQDVSQWLWKDEAGGLPDKDNLLHSFAARYSLPDDPVGGETACPAGKNPTCELLVFGSDRYDNSGDAQQGFWFFQNKITTGGKESKGGTQFTGVHKAGDLLVISDFSNGGTTSTIKVYKWDPQCKKTTGESKGDCGDANLRVLASSLEANCASEKLGAGDEFCGIVNGKTTESPWSFTDKSGSSEFLNGEFYEGGINLSLLGLGGQCFASVASETRSSTSTTATLKDFVLSNFGECTSKTKTTPVSGLDENGKPKAIPPAGLNIPTDPLDAAIQVQDKAEITVAGSSSFSATVSFHLCGPFEASSETLCEKGGVNIGSKEVKASETVVSASATVTSAGRYCWRADFSGDSSKGVPASSDSSATECFKVNPATPEISTQAGAGPVDFGKPVTDTATLKGTAHKPGTGGPEGSNGSINPKELGGDATGKIKFTLYKLVLKSEKEPVCGDLAKSNLESDKNPQEVTVSGDGSEYKASFTPNEPGKYVWVAEYSGDPPNTNKAGPSACSDENEDVEVNQIPTEIITKQSWIPQDTATISAVSGNLGPEGTVTFSLYDNAECSEENGGELVYQETKAIKGGSPTEEVSTSNSGDPKTGGFTITTGYDDKPDSSTAHYAWKVVYTPSKEDLAHTGTESACDAEHFETTYTNDGAPPVESTAAAVRASLGGAPGATAATAAAAVTQPAARKNRRVKHRRHKRHRRHVRHHRGARR